MKLILLKLIFKVLRKIFENIQSDGIEEMKKSDEERNLILARRYHNVRIVLGE